jgi:acetylornithine/succinyldiaminopimelate/putrescine aminotransferase
MEFDENIFLQHLAPTTPFPLRLPIEKAEGIYLYSPGGKRYTDLVSGIGVSNIGHRHPKVIDAIKKQLDKHLHVMVYGEYIQSSSNLLAKKLSELLPPSLDCCYLVNSGTEANEGALKLAKRLTGRTELVSFKRSYHGSTHGSMSVSGNEIKKTAFRPLLPDVRFIEFNNIDDLEQISESTAGVIMETIQGDAGVRIPSKEFMKKLRERCTNVGAMLILDEIQCGMGRAGTLFAFEQFGIVPDILTIGKAFGGGLPIGAFISSRDRMQALSHDPMLGHITTFGGNPVCSASALSTLEVLTGGNLLKDTERKGRLIESLLVHPLIREVRRIGLMFAIDFDTEERVQKIVTSALNDGVVTFWFLSHPYSFRIAPPLTISDDEIRESCAIILKAIEKS